MGFDLNNQSDLFKIAKRNSANPSNRPIDRLDREWMDPWLSRLLLAMKLTVMYV